jgi:very-short-patch-repair endonuclease
VCRPRKDQGVSRERQSTADKLRTPPADLAIARFAGRQHGLVRNEQLRAIGLSRDAVYGRVARGLLHRHYAGVYSVGHAKLSREGEFLAAVYAGGRDALLGHLAAAELCRVRKYRALLIDVVAPSWRPAENGVRFHQSRTVHPRDRTIVNGIPVTSMPRLFVDLTDDLEEPLELANVIHEAAFRGWFDLNATRDAMARANGRHNLRILEEALAANAAGSAGLKSRNEAAFLSMLKRAHLPPAKVNVHVADVEPDFHWPELKLAVEIDGHGHTRPRTQREDALKERLLERAGYRVLRFTEEELERPRSVISAVRAAMG